MRRRREVCGAIACLFSRLFPSDPRTELSASARFIYPRPAITPPTQPKLLVGVASPSLKCFLSFFLPFSFTRVPLNKMTDGLYSK